MDKVSFDEWMDAVDRAVIQKVGLSIHDLADQPFRDWFDDEVTPKEAAKMALDDAGWGE